MIFVENVSLGLDENVAKKKAARGVLNGLFWQTLSLTNVNTV
jgi:hypothetical protein